MTSSVEATSFSMDDETIMLEQGHRDKRLQALNLRDVRAQEREVKVNFSGLAFCPKNMERRKSPNGELNRLLLCWWWCLLCIQYPPRFMRFYQTFRTTYYLFVIQGKKTLFEINYVAVTLVWCILSFWEKKKKERKKKKKEKKRPCLCYTLYHQHIITSKHFLNGCGDLSKIRNIFWRKIIIFVLTITRKEFLTSWEKLMYLLYDMCCNNMRVKCFDLELL